MVTPSTPGGDSGRTDSYTDVSYRGNVNERERGRSCMIRAPGTHPLPRASVSAAPSQTHEVFTMASSLLFRAFAVLLPVVPFMAGCGGATRTSDAGSGGSTSTSGTSSGSSSAKGSCTGTNPGCCELDSTGCFSITEQATCDLGSWTCPGGPPAVGPLCEDICVGSSGNTGTSSGTGSSSGSETGGCSTPNPGCCGFVGQCNTNVGDATCVGGAWACTAVGTSLGPVCTSICMAADAGSPPLQCGPTSVECDGATQYCSVFEGGVALPDGGSSVHASCQTIPAECAGNLGGAAAECACTLSQLHGGGMCSESGSGFTITVAVP